MHIFLNHSKRNTESLIASNITFLPNINMIEKFDFETIENALSEKNTLVFQGPPGIGKTSNAVNFSYQAKEKGWTVLWFNSDTQYKFVIDLQSYTDLMGAELNENKSFMYRTQFIKNKFNLYPRHRFLLVIDNLNELEWIENFLTSMPKNVYVIVTSTKKNILEEYATEYKVDYFTEKDARAFFSRKFKKERDFSNEETILLDKYFQYDQILPYDLNLLASELNNNPDVNLKELLDGYPELCERIFTKLYERINKKLRIAWQTLEYCSLVDPEAIPEFLIIELLKIENSDLEPITVVLEHNSIVQEIFKLNEKCYHIHRRTQEMVKKVITGLQMKDKFETRINDVVSNEFADFTEYNVTIWNNSKLLFPSLLLVSESKLLDKNKRAKNFAKIGIYYENIIIDFNQAIEYQLKSIEIREEIYENQTHRDIAISYFNIGSVYLKLDLTKPALEYLMKSLSIMEELYEKKAHADVASLYNNIGSTFIKLGEFHKGLEYHLKSLATRKEIYGDEKHLDIAISFNNIGATYKDLGDFQNGLDYYLKSLKLLEDIYANENNPTLASLYSNIGVVYGEIYEFQNSLQYHFKSLKMKEDIYGNEKHPELTESFNNIGATYIHMGETKKGIDYFLKGLKMTEELHKGRIHSHIAILCSNIGASYLKLNYARKGLEYMTKSIDILEELYSNEKHPELATSYSNVSGIYISLGETRKGLDYLLQSLKIREDFYGNENHPDIATTYSNIGDAYIKLNELQNGLSYHLKSIKMTEKIYLNRNHPDLATAYSKIGAICFKYSKESRHKGLDYQLKSVKLFEELFLLTPHPTLVKSYKDAGNMYAEMGDLKNCLQFQLKGLIMELKISGKI